MLDMNVIKAKFIKYLIKEGQKKLKYQSVEGGNQTLNLVRYLI